MENEEEGGGDLIFYIKILRPDRHALMEASEKKGIAIFIASSPTDMIVIPEPNHMVISAIGLRIWICHHVWAGSRDNGEYLRTRK